LAQDKDEHKGDRSIISDEYNNFQVGAQLLDKLVRAEFEYRVDEYDDVDNVTVF
jgi:hypothetical protein